MPDALCCALVHRACRDRAFKTPVDVWRGLGGLTKNWSPFNPSGLHKAPMSRRCNRCNAPRDLRHAAPRLFLPSLSLICLQFTLFLPPLGSLANEYAPRTFPRADSRLLATYKGRRVHGLDCRPRENLRHSCTAAQLAMPSSTLHHRLGAHPMLPNGPIQAAAAAAAASIASLAGRRRRSFHQSSISVHSVNDG